MCRCDPRSHAGELPIDVNGHKHAGSGLGIPPAEQVVQKSLYHVPFHEVEIS
jgi:hypothetical protein